MDVDVSVTRVPCVAPSASRTAGARTTCPSATTAPGTLTIRTTKTRGPSPSPPAGLSRPTSGPRPALPPPTAETDASASWAKPRASAVASDTNACAVGHAAISASSGWSVPIRRPESFFDARSSRGKSPPPRGEKRRRRGHATTTPRELCTRRTTGIAGGTGGAASREPTAPGVAHAGFSDDFSDELNKTESPGVAIARSSAGRAGAAGAGVGRHGATRNSVSSLNRATAPAPRGLTDVGTSRRGARFDPPAVSPPPADPNRPFWPADPPPGQNGNGAPSTTHPHCVRRFASTSSAHSSSSSQSRSDSGASSTTSANGASTRPATRHASPSTKPTHSATAIGTSNSVSERETHAAPAHATNAGAA